MMQLQLPTLCQRQQQYMIFHKGGLSGILSLVVSLSREIGLKELVLLIRILCTYLKSTSEFKTVDFFLLWL